MVSIDITERVITYLGMPAGSGASEWSNSDFRYNYAIAGVPFISAINDRTPYIRAPYKRGLISSRREQVDQQQNPGEQSLTGWWLRSQSNFTGGAGITFFEPTNDERTMRRFKDSLGVDCWTLGKLTLLNATTASASTSGLTWPISYGATVAYVYGAATPVISRGGVTTALTGTGTPLAVADDGTSFFRLTTSALYKGTIASGTDAAYYTTTPSTGALGWVKGRLMAGLNNSIYELTGSGAPTLPAATYTHPNTSWAWKSICDGPSAIYAAGFAGSRSAIYKFAVDSQLQGTSLPALTRGTVVADLPTGEVVNAISTYLGRYMAICTNKGVRIAVIDGAGDLTYGPLLWTDAACYSAYGQDRYFFIGTTLSSGPGLIRVDLSDPDNDGRFPFATDLQSGVTGSGFVTSICPIGISDLKALTTSNGSVSYRVEEQSSKVASGWVRFAQTRFSTLEPKHFQLMRLRWDQPMQGTVAISAIASDGAESSVITFGADSTETDVGVPASETVSQGIRLDLTRSATDATKAPVVQGWQFKAVPAVARREMIEIPLLCFDLQRDMYSTTNGYDGFALDRYSLIRDSVASGGVVTFQDLSTGESLEVVVEGLDFEQISPPGIASGFGGILTLTMRQV